MSKRIFDIGIALTLILIGIPVWSLLLFIQYLVWGKIFYYQERIGLNDKAFIIIKLQTLKEGTSPELERLTAWGSFLRKTRLNEFPQLFLILNGTMSMIGPRPLLPEYLEEYSEFQKLRHKVKPGIIGLAQIHGANDLSWEEQFEWDVRYAKEASFLLDLKLFLYFPLLIFKGGLATGRKPFKRAL
ncbi:MAG: sugar transferase [Cytophagaceae bacterium]|nr:sugar transferase [Cytophagaceae bacterium]